MAIMSYNMIMSFLTWSKTSRTSY